MEIEERFELINRLKQSWGAPLVAREKVGDFSGGVLNPRTLANADSLGVGPEGRVKFGRKVAYTVESLIDWMFQKNTINAPQSGMIRYKEGGSANGDL